MRRNAGEDLNCSNSIRHGGIWRLLYYILNDEFKSTFTFGSTSVGYSVSGSSIPVSLYVRPTSSTASNRNDHHTSRTHDTGASAATGLSGIGSRARQRQIGPHHHAPPPLLSSLVSSSAGSSSVAPASASSIALASVGSQLSASSPTPSIQPPCGILKQQHLSDHQGLPPPPPLAPILRRHSQNHGQGSNSVPAISRGILKKHHSLDEPSSSHMRDDDVTFIGNSRRRRGSLDTTALNSSLPAPPPPHGILKRKSLSGRSDSLENPPGILKTSASSSSGDASSSSSGIGEIILSSPPILKTRSSLIDSSGDHGSMIGGSSGRIMTAAGSVGMMASSTKQPKPILKNAVFHQPSGPLPSVPVPVKVKGITDDEEERDDNYDDDEDDEPSKLSIADRVRLFSGGSGIDSGFPIRSSIRRSATTPAVIGKLIGRSDSSSVSEGSDSSHTTNLSRSPSPPKSSPHHSYKRMSVGEEVEECVDGTAVLSNSGVVVSGPPPGGSIADRLAALQLSGANDWRTRLLVRQDKTIESKCNEDDIAVTRERTFSTTSVTERLGQLETSWHGWKSRVVNQNSPPPTRVLHSSSTSSVPKSSPSATSSVTTSIFSSRQASVVVTATTTTTSASSKPPPSGGSAAHRAALNNVLQSAIKRSASANFPRSSNVQHSPPLSNTSNLNNSISSHKGTSEMVVSVPLIADSNFHSFFPALVPIQDEDSFNVVSEVDFVSITTEAATNLLVSKRRVKAKRKHAGSSNPLKALAKRSDLATEYTEKRSFIKPFNTKGFTAEALAGLASTEDTSHVVLKKAEPVSQVTQWSHPLLIRVKGRRRPIVHLVCGGIGSSSTSPWWSIIDKGDAYIIVTRRQVYCWLGEFCNVIERRNATEIAADIVRRKDLGYTSSAGVITLADGGPPSASDKHKDFWSLLGLKADDDISGKDNSDYSGKDEDSERGTATDEQFESWMASQYILYRLRGDELEVIHEASPKHPPSSILDPDQVIIFDAVTEVYCWCGKYSGSKERRVGRALATKLSRSLPSPSGIDTIDREMTDWQNVSSSNSTVAVYTVIQNMEPAIFREKFSDWPSMTESNAGSTPPPSSPLVQRSMSIGDDRWKPHGLQKSFSAIVGSTMRPCDVISMMDWKPAQVDTVLESSHLGRGKKYYDPETLRHFEVSTIDVKMWSVIDGNTVEQNLKEKEPCRLLDNKCYIFKWNYRLTVSGRELGGGVSKYGAVGRDRVAYITWRGSKSGLDGGIAALLAVAMDPDSVQITIGQGLELPAFLSMLIAHPVIIERGNDLSNAHHCSGRLYLIEINQSDGEAGVLREVDCRIDSLRSLASYYLWNADSGKGTVWYGKDTTEESRKSALRLVKLVTSSSQMNISEMHQGEESSAFLASLKRTVNDEHTRLKKMEVDSDDDSDSDSEIDASDLDDNKVEAIFELCPVKGEYSAIPLAPVRFNPEQENFWPYRYSQEEVYASSEGCTLLVDGGESGGIWLWCRSGNPSTLAIDTALSYHTAKYGGASSNKPYIIVPYAEPDKFIRLFPYWTSWQNGSVAVDILHTPPSGWSVGEKRPCISCTSNDCDSPSSASS